MTNCKVVAALVGLGLALPVVALAQDLPLEEQLVNAMNKVFGVHPGFRANHAKGIVVEGSFRASPGSGRAKPSGAVQRRHDPSDGAQRHRYCDQFF